MNTLLLDGDNWDLVVDASGNIAVASPPYATAQDIASAVRLFQGELWYDTSKGVPYFQSILGHQPAPGILKSVYLEAASNVPDVVDAQVYITGISGRAVTGQIQAETSDGTTVVVSGGLQPLTGPIVKNSKRVVTDALGRIVIAIPQ